MSTSHFLIYNGRCYELNKKHFEIPEDNPVYTLFVDDRKEFLEEEEKGLKWTQSTRGREEATVEGIEVTLIDGKAAINGHSVADYVTELSNTNL